MASATEQSRTMLNISLEERRAEQSTLVLKQRYKWRILISTAVINVMLAGFLPSLGVLLYFDLQDKQVSLGDAIRTPIYFIIAWCFADSWSQTAYTTPSFKKFAVAASIVTAISIGVNFLFHDTLESARSHYLLGFVAGAGVRVLTAISANCFSEYFTNSTWANVLNFFIMYSLGTILVPLLVAYIADTEGIHYAILMLGALALQTLPSVILLRKPRQANSHKRLCLTNQPAYALLHNENDDCDEQPEGAETSLSQPFTKEMSTTQDNDGGDRPSNELKQRSTTNGSNNETVDNLAVPLFTDVELVAETYQGKVAYSFEDTMSESPRHDSSELFFQGLARRRIKHQNRNHRCCGFCIIPSLHQELHPFKHPILYLGLVSMITQELITIMVWILLPTLTCESSHAISQDLDVDVASKMEAAYVSVITGIASIPVILIPFIFSSFSLKGHKFAHGISAIFVAVFIYGLGTKLPGLHIGVLTSFGLSNAISAGALEPILKGELLKHYHFKRYKTREEIWGNIRGLAKTVVGLVILLISIAIDLLITDWNDINWPLLFYVTASLQLFTGIMWTVTPPCHWHCF